MDSPGEAQASVNGERIEQNNCLVGSNQAAAYGQTVDMPLASRKMAPPSNWIHSLDGLRGIAILLVFGVHTHAVFSAYLPETSVLFLVSEGLSIIGHFGVDLFFMMSGYLIYRNLMTRETPYWDFIGRRVKRVYPTFLAVMTAYLALSLVFPEQNKIHGEPFSAALYILENLLLLPGLFPITPIMTVAWVLSFEFTFYLVAPAIVRVFRMGRLSGEARVASLILAIGLLLVVGNLWKRGDLLRFTPFISGILVYELGEAGVAARLLNAKGEVMAVIFLLATMVLYQCGFTSADGGQRVTQVWNALVGPIPYCHNNWRALAITLSTCCLGIFCVYYNGWVGTMLTWAPLRWLGGISYSFFLLHGLVLKGVAWVLVSRFPELRPDPSTFMTIVGMSLLFALVASTLLYSLIERPFSSSPHRRYAP